MALGVARILAKRYVRIHPRARTYIPLAALGVGFLTGLGIVLGSMAFSSEAWSIFVLLPLGGGPACVAAACVDQRGSRAYVYAALGTIGALLGLTPLLLQGVSHGFLTICLPTLAGAMFIANLLITLAAQQISRVAYTVVYTDGFHCPACEYRLTGSLSFRCPECGRVYTYEELGVTADALWNDATKPKP